MRMYTYYVLPVMAAIFDLPLALMSESFHTSSAVLADLANVDVAFGISLLSRIEAQILCIFVCTFGNDCHL